MMNDPQKGNVWGAPPVPVGVTALEPNTSAPKPISPFARSSNQTAAPPTIPSFSRNPSIGSEGDFKGEPPRPPPWASMGTSTELRIGIPRSNSGLPPRIQALDDNTRSIANAASPRSPFDKCSSVSPTSPFDTSIPSEGNSPRSPFPRKQEEVVQSPIEAARIFFGENKPSPAPPLLRQVTPLPQDQPQRMVVVQPKTLVRHAVPSAVGVQQANATGVRQAVVVSNTSDAVRTAPVMQGATGPGRDTVVPALAPGQRPAKPMSAAAAQGLVESRRRAASSASMTPPSDTLLNLFSSSAATTTAHNPMTRSSSTPKVSSLSPSSTVRSFESPKMTSRRPSGSLPDLRQPKKDIDKATDDMCTDLTVTCFPSSSSGLFPTDFDWDSEEFDDPKYVIFRKAMLETFQMQVDYPLLMPPDLTGMLLQEF
ncbi:uncharacterized protein SPPG_05386 [Spizellomyces punctatus DAOM BR117]|uniref:Uncharacterized protein n=1 Tax=Spizellomyces punctatus (strain DAOM BR117) TaxID=645134 RepID=A0A0L0HDC7_SPIPD|nr:uncharacterized protein SPPG_05386 [Spizellomyces punctatus DAOM BR117]KNC99127.1 hypothetical protein SPPG_05386 [Spizellomyces punctatus DAOM BR117]|eukprot:XP_016607167.1 hypothetical protein SPPG_05386 [Spizellomyces punctatus DAOM BR117]